MTEHYYNTSHGAPIPGECIVELRSGETEIPFYRFIVPGAAAGRYKLSGANARVSGVTVPDELMMDLARTKGERSERTGYTKGPMATKRNGFAYIELGSGGGVAGNLVKSDANGKAIVYTKVAPGESYAQADAQGINNRIDIVAGELLESGSEGDIVLIDLDRR